MTRPNSEYRLKVAFREKSGGGTLYEYIAFNERDELAFLNSLDLDLPKYRGYITTLPKADWTRLLPEIKRICETQLRGWYKSYKLSFEEAFSADEVITVYYVPNRRRVRALTLAELKKELKLEGIRVVSIEQDAYRGVKYYALYIPKQYKRKVDAFINEVSSTTDIGYKLQV